MKQNVGERQRWAWLSAALSGITAAEICGYCWLWVLLGGAAAMLYHLWLEQKAGSDGLARVIKTAFGRFGNVLLLATFLWITLVMGWTASLADKAFPMVEGFPTLGWILLGLAAWGSWKGTKACAGCCGVLSLFLLALYGLIGGFSLPDIKAEYLGIWGTWTDIVWIFGLFLLSITIWYMPGEKQRKRKSWSLAIALPAASAGLAAAAAGVLSPIVAKEESVPLYALAQSVSLFGVVERIEPLLSAAITMGVFALLSLLACGCGAVLGEVYLRIGRLGGPVSCLLASGMMYLSRYLTVELLTTGVWLFWVVIPVITMFFQKHEDGNATDCGVET